MKIIHYRKSKNGDGYTYYKDNVHRGEIKMKKQEFTELLQKCFQDEKIEKSAYLGSGDYPYMTQNMLLDYAQTLYNTGSTSLGVHWTRYIVSLCGMQSKLRQINYLITLK